ncbi:MAG TPA: hypothetical protein ENN19_04710, partial [Chloroflexi bacterium]|nr:hypothetical protein [Chloroflexota bacterium]
LLLRGLAASLDGAPTVAGVEPPTITNDADRVITISGAGFAAVLSGTAVITPPTVYLGGTPLGDAGWINTTTLTITAPLAFPVGVYTVTVVNPDGQSGSLAEGLTVQYPAPVLQGLSPVSGTYGQAPVLMITGTGFVATPTVALGEYACAVGYVSSTTLTATVPSALLPGIYDLTVRNPGPGEPQAVLPDAFTLYSPTPTVTGIEPTTAPNDLDSPVVIVGTDFAPTPTVTLGAIPLQAVTWVSATQLSAVVPWGMDVGSYDLEVTNPSPGGAPASLVNVFTVTQGINTWTTGGPYGGVVEFLALGDGQGEIVYAIVNNVGLFRSRNGGESWEWLFLTGHSDRVEVDPTNPDRLYIARATHHDRNLYRSEDGGDTWTAMPPILGNDPSFYAFVKPGDGTLFVAHYDTDIPCPSGCGLLRFDEINQSWVQLEEAGLLDDTTPVSKVAFDPHDPDIMYAGLFGGLVLKSEDGGETWSSLGQPPTDDFNELQVNPVTREVWATCGGRNSSLPGGLYRHDGSEWVSMYTSPQLPSPAVWNIIFANAPDVNTQQIWIAADTDGLLRSNDGGQTWLRLGHDEAGLGQVNAIALNPAHPETIYGGTHEGISKTNDGGATWQLVNEGLTGIIAQQMAVSPHDPAVVYGVGSDIIFGSLNGGNAWEKLLPASAGVIVVDPVNPNRVVNTANGVLNIAEDGWHFDTHIPITLPLGMGSEDYFAVSMAMIARPGLWVLGVGYYDRLFPNWNYDGGGGIYTSADGEDWTLIAYLPDGPPTGFGFDPGDENVIYAITSGGEHGVVIYEGTFLRSTDGGQTWHESAAGSPPTGNVIAVEPRPPYRIFDGCSVSEDQGVTWSDTACPGDSPASGLVFLEGDPLTLYASTGAGLFRSIDGARTWQRGAGALGHLHIWSIAGTTVDGRQILYVGTAGGELVGGGSQAMGLASGPEQLINAGVYRFTTLSAAQRIYLPLVLRH